MEGKDNIKELFSQKLGNYEAPVNPELWAKISSQVAAGAATTAATGLSVFAKVAIGLGVSAAAITTVVLLTSSPEEVVLEKPTIETQKEVSVTDPSENDEVADVSTDTETDLVGYRDVRKHLNTSPNGGLETTKTSSSTVNPNPTAANTGNPDRSVSGMATRTPKTITGGGTSEPTIVEGVSFGDMTNYGTAPANTPDPISESTEPKVEPIKRFVNTFTPNGDGTNDYFALESEGLTNFSVVVFNPDGDIVFQSDDPAFSWDGRDIRSGDMVDPGTYMYMVAAYDAEGNPYPIYERLTINR